MENADEVQTAELSYLVLCFQNFWASFDYTECNYNSFFHDLLPDFRHMSEKTLPPSCMLFWTLEFSIVHRILVTPRHK